MTTLNSIPYTEVTSVYGSAASVFSSATSVLATATDTVTSKSLANAAQQAQATMSFYSYLEILATATDDSVKSTVASQAIAASSSMIKLFDDNTFYNGNTPSLGGNVALLVVMGIFLAFHIAAGVFYKEWWLFSCWTIGLILEVLGYVGRVMSSHDVSSFNGYILQIVCLILGPSFIMAGLYYTLAQLTVVMGEYYSRLKPMQYTLIFVICDLIGIVIQAVGGAMAASSVYEFSSSRPGANIMVGGIAVQVASMSLFQALWYDFLYACYKERKATGDAHFVKRYQFVRDNKLFTALIWSISLSVLFIYVRSIYRLIELAQGFSGHLAVTEIYFFILESLMMCLAILLITVLYPGFVYGRNPDLIVDKRLKTTFSMNRTPKPNTIEDSGIEEAEDEAKYTDDS
ncbi:hypothetical protein CANARDRAFT_5354 [[Candida] arabinofermentans NRRL YB-2248]|uniref:Sphingoid long-chain base transporter RSB1 n=1 Tax=[Candida] arabinofermentans NRRL YB-2248 TaxID=983967 RepID=A0A1E4T8I5_9ASCO|nr:hypothetical protein CANARDRAFT_5354 [[Candida] arabinofermentans NRRL YB-2248]